MALVPEFIRKDLDACKVVLRRMRLGDPNAAAQLSDMLVSLMTKWRNEPAEMTEDNPPLPKAHVSEIVSYWRDELPPGNARDAVTASLADYADKEQTASYRDSIVKEAEYQTAEKTRAKEISIAVDLAVIQAVSSLELVEIETILTDREGSRHWEEATAKLPMVREKKEQLAADEQASIDALQAAEKAEIDAHDAEAAAEERERMKEKESAIAEPRRGSLPSKDINGEPVILADLNLDSEIDTLPVE